MNNIYRQLAALDFGTILANAKADTQTGLELINKYRRYCMENAVNCGIVNGFIKEASKVLYDNSVAECLNTLNKFIKENKISWQLASVCESINADTNPRNYLNRHAAREASRLLEMQESDVVAYIKSGYLKNVMHCQPIRAIAKAVFNESMKYVEEDVNYSVVNPISCVYQADNGDAYFNVVNRTFCMHEDGTITEEKCNNTAFNIVNQLLESQYVTYKDETFFVNFNNTEYQISEANHCVRLTETTELDLDINQLREYNAIQCQNMTPGKRNQVAPVLEAIAKLCENFDNVALIESASIYTTPSDQFLLVEGKDNCFAQLLSSTHAQHAWAINENMGTTVQFIKEHTHVNLASHFDKKINAEINEAKVAEEEAIAEALRDDTVKSYKKRVELLIEKFKDDPIKMAVVSQLAAQIGQL